MMRFKRAGRLVLVAALSTTATGCQNGFSVPVWNPFAKSTASTTQSSTPQFGQAPSEDSWAKKLTKPFKSAGTTAKKPTVAENDPIALATKTAPPDGDLYVSLAKLQERSGNTAGAIEEYNKALDADAKSLPAMLGLARLYDRQGRYDDAIKLYRTASELHADNAAVANDYGLCLARSGNIKESAVALRKAVSLDSEKVLYRNNLATVLVELGRVDEAYETLVPAHGEAVAHYNVGFLLNKRETEAAKTAAYDHFREAAKLNPDFKEAQQWLTVLKKHDPNPSAAPIVVASKIEPAAPISTPVPRSVPPVVTLPPTVSLPTPMNGEAATPVPARPISQPTVIIPTPADAQRYAPVTVPNNPQSSLNQPSRTLPTVSPASPAAVPPVPEQVSRLNPTNPAVSAAMAKPETPAPASSTPAARYPASRY